MQIENVKDYHDRVALFPGKSCYPLSNDNLDAAREETKALEEDKGRVDQLSVIFDVIGTPNEAEIEQIPDSNTKVMWAYFLSVDSREYCSKSYAKSRIIMHENQRISLP